MPKGVLQGEEYQPHFFLAATSTRIKQGEILPFLSVLRARGLDVNQAARYFSAISQQEEKL